MEISSFSPDEGGRFGPRTLSAVSISSNASAKSHSGVGVLKHVKDAKVKLMCSYGGRILPRPSDKKLRYVGGETRVISVPRHINFSDLLCKMSDIYGPDIALRYQLPEEDLDALVSVTSDEDLQNMMDECDRLNAIEGSSRLRMFVFSSLELDYIGLGDISDPRVSEQHYVDAVNAVQREVSMKKIEDASYVVGTFQSQALPFDRNLHLGSFPLLSQEPKNESGFIAPSIHETAKLWKELSFNQNPGIENLVDLESGVSAGSSISSQHDVYNNQQQFPILRDQSYLESRSYGNDADQIYMHGQMQIEEIKMPQMQETYYNGVGRKSSLDLDEQVYTQEAPSENIHGKMFPLSPGARLQRQLEVDQRKAVEPLFNGVEMYNPVTVFVEERVFNGVSSIKQASMHATLPKTGDLFHPVTMFVEERVFNDVSSNQQASMYTPLPETGDLFQQQGPWLSSKVEGQAQLSEKALQLSQSSLLLQPNILLDEEITEDSNYSLQAFSAKVDHDIKNEIDISGKNVLNEFGYGQKRSITDLAALDSVPVSTNDLPDKVFIELGAADKKQVAGGLSLLDDLVQLETIAADTIPESDKGIFISSDAPLVEVINSSSTETPKIDSEALISMDSLLNAKQLDITLGMAEVSVNRISTQDIFGLHYDIKTYSKEVVHEDSRAVTLVKEYESEEHRNIESADASQAPPLSWTLQESDLPLEIERDAATEDQRSEVEMDAFMSANDMPVNAAAAAEAEAIARGLQTIHNCDLEELRELGSGTFGTVYHGKWRGTDVAIKRIKSSCFTGRPAERERLIADFWQEAYILGQLHHPNVVAFYGVVPDGPNETLATVTEYMVNGSLKQCLLKRDRSLDLQKRLLIAMDAAFGMEYLHGKNVVHFDLKCENLLVNLRDIDRPICKVGDLGLSKVKQQTMISGGVRGTLPWMAPELLNGSSSLVSEKVDVFSFGIVLWELLTGEEPYANMHYGAIIGGIVSNTLRPPIPKWCDEAWKSLMERCWSAIPAERPTFSQIAITLREMEATYTAKKQLQAPLSG